MRKLLVFVLLLIFFLRGLANEKKVFIKGTFLQTKMSSVNLLYYDIIKENFCYLSTSDVSEKGFFLMTFQLKKPILCKFYEDFFFVTPGDSINIYIEDDSNSSKGYKLKLEGKNVSHYKFSNFVKTHSTIDIDKELKNYDGNWQVFQKTCLKKYNEDMELLNLYSSLDSVSVDFYDYYKNNFFCEYLQYLLLPPHVDKNYDWYLINSFLCSLDKG